jgi:hypothetical protein
MPDLSEGHVAEPSAAAPHPEDGLPDGDAERGADLNADPAELGGELGADLEGAPPAGPGDLEPGTWVRHPGQPDWGEGQVQSAIGPRVTVNFENAGKVLVNVRVVKLERID